MLIISTLLGIKKRVIVNYSKQMKTCDVWILTYITCYIIVKFQRRLEHTMTGISAGQFYYLFISYFVVSNIGRSLEVYGA